MSSMCQSALSTFTSSKGDSRELNTMPAVPADRPTEKRSGRRTSACVIPHLAESSGPLHHSRYCIDAAIALRICHPYCGQCSCVISDANMYVGSTANESNETLKTVSLMVFGAHPKRAEHVGIHSVVDACRKRSLLNIKPPAVDDAGRMCNISAQMGWLHIDAQMTLPVSSAPPISGADTPRYSPRTPSYFKMLRKQCQALR